MRLIFVCASALIFPISIVAADKTANVICNFAGAAGMSTITIGMNATNAAAFPAVLINAVTIVGAP